MVSNLRGFKILFFVLVIGPICNHVSAQKRPINKQVSDADTTIYFLFNHLKDSIRITSDAKRRYTGKSGYDTILVRHYICKNIFVLRYRIVERSSNFPETLQAVYPVAREPFLKITGSIQYDFLYRSYVDTPFAQHDYQQHTLQASLNIKLRNKYPLRLCFSIQQNNSPYFSNLANLNLQFDPYRYLLDAKQRVLGKLETIKYEGPELKMAEAALNAESEKYNALRAHILAPDVLQRLVEEREKKYYAEQKKNNQAAAKTPFNTDSLSDSIHNTDLLAHNKSAGSYIDSLLDATGYTNMADSIKLWKRQADSLQNRVTKLQHKTDSLKAVAGKSWNSVRQKIYAAKNHEQLQNIERENGIALEKPGKLDRILTNVRTIGIGRSLLDYSELTASNILLTGANIEYNAKNYIALAAGKVDYGYRDFFGGNRSGKNQNFLIGRIGLGNRESKAVIFSLFTGRKYSYGSKGTDSLSNYSNITGYSVEVILKKNESQFINLEIAKTTKPFSGSYSNNGALKGLSDFNDMTTIGLSIKAQTVIEGTNTHVSGFYRKTGENFQSFSLFTYNVDQTAWNLRVDQALLKKRISLTAMLRRNDFVNPFTDKVFKTNTIFKSFQATVRIPKYPTLSVGYYPGSQVYVIDKVRASENVYYILNGSLVHTYPIGDVRMSSAFTFNQYSNKAMDSGFIAYKGVSYTASQGIDIDRLQLQGLYTFTDQERLRYNTIEGNADYSLTKIIEVGVGLKYNKILNGEAYRGGRVYLSAEIKPLGRLRVQYEKSYLPTLQQTLFPIETGRISWLKNL